MVRVLAVDIGAGSYRVMEGELADGRISMKELARFSHAPVCSGGHYYWDVNRIMDNLTGVIKEAANRGEEIRSIGFDTFGTDFGLLDKDGSLLAQPFAYRDSISDGIRERYFADDQSLYESIGGTYTLPSTAHILLGMKEQGLQILKKAKRLLFLPDLLGYLFTGNAVNEYTIATTSRLLDIRRRTWDDDLIKELGLPGEIFHPLSDSGTVIGTLRKEIVSGIKNLKHTVVTAAACHDTASAAVTIPEIPDSSFISSGSWSVKGIISSQVYTSNEAYKFRMCNEGQPGRKYRLLRNIAGLWILEECVRSLQKQGRKICIPQLAAEAQSARPFPSMIYTDAEDFEKPGDMPLKIQMFCRRTGQRIPETPEELMQTIVGGLACEYRRHNEELAIVTGEKISGLYIVGGGLKNQFLDQSAADASGCTVTLGHPEATALGNLLVQYQALGEIGSVEAAAGMAENDIKKRVYIPGQTEQWEEKYRVYKKLTEQSDITQQVTGH